MTERSDKPILRVLRGEAVEPRPVWLMRQAGRYLPEYRALRAKAPDFLSLCLNPTLSTEITLQPIHRFGFDAAILFADILLIPHALGQRVWFAEGEGPRLDPLSAGSVGRLSTTGVRQVLSPVLETVQRVRAKLPEQTGLIGFAGAPWTVATYMLAGRSTDDSAPARAFATAHPAAFHMLLSILVDATTEYLTAQVEAGAEVLQIFESWAGTVPPDKVEAYSLAPIREIVTRVRERTAVPVIVFPRGASTNYLRYACESEATALSIDTETSIASAAKNFPSGLALQGNLDPEVLIAGGTPLAAAVKRIKTDTRGRPHIFNLGHGVRPETPVENVAELVRLIRTPLA